MEREMVTFEQVKKDLRNLRHIEYSIRTFSEARSRLQHQYDECEKAGDVETLEKLKESISKLDANGFIKRSIVKKDKYFKAIACLEPMNQTIIIDSVINGVPYWKIGNQLGFSEVAIKKRVNKAINQIAELVTE